jgi:Uma2 family endonuclease
VKVLKGHYTRADFDRLPEGFPGELIEGQLVKDPGPTYGHNRICARIRLALLQLLGPDRVPDSPSDVAIDDHNVFQPDVVVLSEPVDDATSYVGVPLLAVEVLSPSTRSRDRSIKAERLLEIGVAEVWLVEPATRTIEVRTVSRRAIARGQDEAVSRAVPGFARCPETLFAKAG